MSETARDLVERMAAAGEWPEPALMEAILPRGEEAVGPLIEVVRRGGHGWPEEAPVDHAIGLLSELKSPAAVPALLEVFRRYDNETLEALPRALRPFGTAVVEPMLEVVRDAGLPWYSRAVATGIALDVTEGEPELRARLLETLRGLLADYVARADSVSGDEVAMASSLVVDLASVADPQARDLLGAALDAGLSEMMGPEDVEDRYRKGGWKSRPEEDWLTEYRRHYREEQARKAAPPAPPLPPVSPPRPAPRAAIPHLPPPPKAVPAQARQTPGRNEPCWCGSGKKYKNCHLHQDRK